MNERTKKEIIDEFFLSSKGYDMQRFKDAYHALIDAGLSLDKNKGDIGGYALLISSYCGSVECVEFLVNQNVDVNFVDRSGVGSVSGEGNTALIHMVKNQNNNNAEGICKITSILLKAGANIDAQNDDGCTALIESIVDGRADNIKILLKAGADFDVLKSKDGFTAESQAKYMSDHFFYTVANDLIQKHKRNIKLEKNQAEIEKESQMKIEAKKRQKSSRINLRRYVRRKGM